MSVLQLGTAKEDVTPLKSIKLAGFGHRKGEATGIFERLYLRGFLLKQANDYFLLFVADFIWWDTAFVQKMKEKIEVKYQIPKEQIVFHATHNHSGPQMSPRFSRHLGECKEGYLENVEEKLIQSVMNLFQDLEEVSLLEYEGTSKIGINRRKITDNKVVMEPNPEGAVDNTLKIFSFVNETNEKKAIWIHYTCHPTTTDENVISGEFPGVCCHKLEEEYPGSNAAFLQGFCGDIRPALIRNEKFYRGSIDDMLRIGETFFDDVQQILKSTGKISKDVPFVFREKEIPVTFSDENSESRVPAMLKDEWPHLVSAIDGDYFLILHYIKLSECLEFVTCNAELVHAYGTFLKKQNEMVTPLGYSNGMVGYIPTSKQLKEGGYEADESLFYFGYPSKIANEMENIIKMEMKKLMRKDFEYDRDHS